MQGPIYVIPKKKIFDFSNEKNLRNIDEDISNENPSDNSDLYNSKDYANYRKEINEHLSHENKEGCNLKIKLKHVKQSLSSISDSSESISDIIEEKEAKKDKEISGAYLKKQTSKLSRYVTKNEEKIDELLQNAINIKKNIDTDFEKSEYLQKKLIRPTEKSPIRTRKTLRLQTIM